LAQIALLLLGFELGFDHIRVGNLAGALAVLAVIQVGLGVAERLLRGGDFMIVGDQAVVVVGHRRDQATGGDLLLGASQGQTGLGAAVAGGLGQAQVFVNNALA